MLIKPNTLTFVRLILAFSIPYFLVVRTSLTSRLIAFVVFLIAGMTDIWDGMLARKTGKITSSGQILDPIADKFLILGAMASSVYLQLYSFWFFLPILIREVLVTVLRLVWFVRGRVVSAEKAGKLKTALQITSLVFSYFYLLERDYSRAFGLWNPKREGLFLFGNYFFLVIAVAVTLVSGWSLVRNNWNSSIDKTR